MGFIVDFLFFIQSGESIYDLPYSKFILWYLYNNKLTQSLQTLHHCLQKK